MVGGSNGLFRVKASDVYLEMKAEKVYGADACAVKGQHGSVEMLRCGEGDSFEGKEGLTGSGEHLY